MPVPCPIQMMPMIIAPIAIPKSARLTMVSPVDHRVPERHYHAHRRLAAGGSMSEGVRALYEELLGAWNRRDAAVLPAE